jgi:hypothetical protein
VSVFSSTKRSLWYLRKRFQKIATPANETMKRHCTSSQLIHAMPIQCYSQSLVTCQILLFALEKAVLRKSIHSTKLTALMWLCLDSKRARGMHLGRRTREMIGMLRSMDTSFHLINLPFQQTSSQSPLKTPEDFNHIEFVQQFRFPKAHFFLILCCLTDDNGH